MYKKGTVVTCIDGIYLSKNNDDESQSQLRCFKIAADDSFLLSFLEKPLQSLFEMFIEYIL